jgi:transposase-like protein
MRLIWRPRQPKLERCGIEERAARGRADAKAKGVKFGRKPKLTGRQKRETIRALKRAGELETRVQHRQVKYRNNRPEADHGALKRRINPPRGFKTPPTASATIKGFEVMRMIRKRQCLMLESGAMGEVRFVNRLFRLAA